MEEAVLPDAIKWFEKGTTLQEQNKYDDAVDAYSKAIEIDPKYALARSNLGDALYHQGKHDEAIEAYNMAADDFLSQGKKEEALKTYDKAIKLNPQDAYALEKKADVLWNLGRFAEAIDAYNEFYLINGNDDEYSVEENFDRMGVRLAKMGKYDEAIDCFEMAQRFSYENSGSSYAYSSNNEGVVLYGLGKYDEAIEYFDGLGEDDFAEQWYNLGNILSHHGDHIKAIEAYDRAISLNPSFTSAWNNRGVSLYHLGKHKEALNAFDKTLEIDARRASARDNKSLMIRLQDKAQKDFESKNGEKEMDSDIECTDLVRKSLIKEQLFYIHYNGGMMGYVPPEIVKSAFR